MITDDLLVAIFLDHWRFSKYHYKLFRLCTSILRFSRNLKECFHEQNLMMESQYLDIVIFWKSRLIRFSLIRDHFVSLVLFCLCIPLLEVILKAIKNATDTDIIFFYTKQLNSLCLCIYKLP